MASMPISSGSQFSNPKDPYRSSSIWEEPKSYPKIPKLDSQVTITSLFPQFDRWAIGFDPLFDTFRNVSANTKTAGYPPYNIYKSKDNYVLEIAVAGFSKEDIKISVQELTLTVEGSALPSVDSYVHKGIATRDFKQDFVLAEYVVVDSAELKDGMLRILLKQELPEEKKAKTIEIS